MGVDLGWHKCVKCDEMFLWGSVAGACAGGNSHDAGDASNPPFIGIIDPIVEGTNLSSIQTTKGWKRCSFCQCMYHELTTLEKLSGIRNILHGGGPLKACPAIGGNGQHGSSGSPSYLVCSGFAAADGIAPFMVAGWLRCGKCEALFQASSDNTGGRCISDGKPHIGIRTPLFACKERLARLPLPSKAGPGMDVNLKVDSKTAIGWVVASGCTWSAASETRLSGQSKWGESIGVTFDFEMIDGPECKITLNVGGDKKIDIPLLPSIDINVPETNIQQSLPCADFDGTTDPDVEFSPGVNNGVILQMFPLGKMFPKNNNRVRIHLNQPLGGFDDFELETQ